MKSKTRPGERTRPATRWGIVFGSAALATIFGAWFLVEKLGYSAACPFRALTGAPCPTCFGLRALAALGRGDVAGAVAAHPLFALGAIALVAWGALDGILAAVGGSRIPFADRPEPRRALRWAIPAVIVANWIFLACRK
jgi:hypothetical protein